MKLIKPPGLKAGDTLGVIACSNPIQSATSETIHRAYSRLKEKGFEVIEAPNCRKLAGHNAGTIQERVEALHHFFRDQRVSGILSFWGGFQSHQLLEYLDYDLIRNNPKPFIGYSDTTALQAGIYAQTKLVTFSGPAGITFGKPLLPDFTWEHFAKVLIKPQVPLKLYHSQDYSDNRWYLESDQICRRR